MDQGERTEKILAFLARPFNTATGTLLRTFVETSARELTADTEEVVLVDSGDARGNGSFTIVTRFEPIFAVDSVVRVDGTGAELEVYDVLGFDGRQIFLDGAQEPQAGDFLAVSYTYTHQGLEYRIRQAILELNILTAQDEFLDEWGRWFATPRLRVGPYGTVKYGSIKYGEHGRESDTQYSRRIIDKIAQRRNTIPSILAAVRRVTGGDPYIVEWFTPAVDNGWVYVPTGTDEWEGEADTSLHLIWGRTSRFLDATEAGGGACVFEVWIPVGAGYSTQQILQVVNEYKAAGTKAFIRYQT